MCAGEIDMNERHKQFSKSAHFSDQKCLTHDQKKHHGRENTHKCPLF